VGHFHTLWQLVVNLVLRTEPNRTERGPKE